MNRLSLLKFLFTITSTFALFRPVFPAVIEMKNGDRISGTVKALASGELTVETAYAGTLDIKWDLVQGFASDESVLVKFSQGKSLEGQLQLDASGEVVVRSPQRTETFPRSQLHEFGPPPREEHYKPWQAWHGDLKFGLNLSRGNTDISTISFIADPARVTPEDRISIHYASLQSHEDGRQLGAVYRLSGRYDRFFSERKFVFAQGRFERDGKATLDYRFREGGGLGYDVLSRSDVSLALTGGFFLSQERFYEEPINRGAEGSVGIELETSLLNPVHLTSRGEFNPVVSENRFFANWSSAITMPLFGNLRFGFQFLDSYDSSPAQETRKNDLQFLSTLTWGF